MFACVRACEKERERRFLACILSDGKCLTEVIHGEFRRIGSEEARRSRPRRREERRGKTHIRWESVRGRGREGGRVVGLRCWSGKLRDEEQDDGVQVSRHLSSASHAARGGE